MKKLRTYIFALAVTALSMLTASCDSFLDELPDNRMELKNPEEISKLLVSAYPEINPAYLLEMYSDNTDEMNSTAWSAADRFQVEAYNWDDITDVDVYESPQTIWNTHYTAIAAANEALAYIARHPEQDLSAQKGEALLCRAYAMFVMSNVFCVAYDETTAGSELGLPYPTEPETQVGTKYDRGTLAQLYANIEKDLTEGLQLVGNSYNNPKFHFTQTSASAFAARFYLYYHKYDKAVEYANYVLGDSPATKLRDWASWSALSANDFIQPNAYVNSSQQCNLLLQVCFSQWGVINGPYLFGDRYAHNRLISTTETLQAQAPWGNSTDMNYKVWYNSSLSESMLRKVPYSFEYSDIQANIGQPHSEFAVFTTDETLLVRAEAYIMLEQYDKAVADINTELSVFSKGTTVDTKKINDFYNDMAYYTPTAPTPKKQFHTTFAIEKGTQENMLHCLLQLRRVVLIHEGFRMQDVKRYGIEIYRRIVNTAFKVESVTDEMKQDDPRRAIQLPQDVINAGLQPNPRTL